MPQITAIKTQKKDPGRVSLYLDGKFAFGLGRDLSTKAGLSVGKKLSEETIENLRRESEEEKFLNLAYRYLSYRPRSEKEVVDHLTKKKVNEKTITKIVARLKEQNYLDDEDWHVRKIGVDALISVLEFLLNSPLETEENVNHHLGSHWRFNLKLPAKLQKYSSLF